MQNSPTKSKPSDIPRVAVIGGGISGLAAAATLAETPFHVELFEAASRLGGRAASFEEPNLGAWVDRCRHVAMGCCTEFLRFAKDFEIEDCFTKHRRLHFFSPTGEKHDFESVRRLPAPLHLLPGFWKTPYLNRGDKLRIMRLLSKLMWIKPRRGETALQWLHREGQSDTAIRRFWSVVLISALSDSLDQVDAAAARKVFRDGFLGRRQAYELFVPSVPLSEIFDRRVGDALAARGVTIHRRAKVRSLAGDATGVRELVTADGTRRDFTAVVAAVPWYCLKPLLGDALWEAAVAPDHRAQIDNIRSAPIASVHLWFDRPITPLPHAVLLERLGDWLFVDQSRKRNAEDVHQEPRPERHGDRRLVDRSRKRDARAVHHEVVISAADDWLAADTTARTDRVVEQLRWLFDPSHKTHLVRGRTVVEPKAVFSPTPALEANRPPQKTRVPNLTLAGDWTDTGWPATMESAVRSGRAAAKEAIRGGN